MDMKRTTVRDIRRRNRSVLLSKLFFHGPLSRLELSGLTGLSAATASTVTAELIVERGATALVHAPTIGWRSVALERLLRDRGVTLPLFVENGAKTQGQAEMWFGAGRGARHAVIVLVGSGVGAAVINDGTTYRGVSSSAGEWGHTTLVYGGRECRCGARG